MRNFSLALVTLIALLSAASAKKIWGLCPGVDSNIKNKEYNVTKMMGIWYEYLVTNDYKEGHEYDCASWLMLQENKTDAEFTIINNRLNSATNDTKISHYMMDCSPTQVYTNTAVCYFQPYAPKNYLEHYTSHKTRSFRIIYTDYYSHLIASVCQSYGLFYYQDYIVLTRDKNPSKFHRKMMKETLAKYALTGKDFDKGNVGQCWGEDMWNV
ncbi:hypothetical protein FGO68_gene11818 [Halteria grandinella]|uniref:Uncharacterized protein n=1 Tax=Halteria grandinella TaxID=5974 RepID=A0A8J8NNC6_HALGN|nr:hypothetical protein FGO68_gene11818 [Halteria grandinella]